MTHLILTHHVTDKHYQKGSHTNIREANDNRIDINFFHQMQSLLQLKPAIAHIEK